MVDVLSMAGVVAALITGLVLHKEVWHLHRYDDAVLWGAHECVALVLFCLLAGHCVQHSFWFKSYAKLKVNRKLVTTVLLAVGVVVALTGVVLMCGSRSEILSHVHYAGGILFTVIAVGHVVKRWKILKSLF